MAGSKGIVVKENRRGRSTPWLHPCPECQSVADHTTPGNPGQKCASSPSPRDSECSWGSSTYKECSGLAGPLPLSHNSCLVFLRRSLSLSSHSHLHSSNPCLYLHTWMDGLDCLLAQRLVSTHSQFLFSPANIRVIFRNFCPGFIQLDSVFLASFAGCC